MSPILTGRPTASTCGIVLVGLWVMLGFPQGSAAQQPPTGPPVHIPSGESFTDQELSAFARAYQAVTDLTERRRTGGKGRGTAEFSAARARLIEEQGLSEEQYNRIVTAMNRDPRLRERIEPLLDELDRDRPARGGSG